MKKMKFMSSAAIMAAALLLASCANEEPMTGGGNTTGQSNGTPLTFNASQAAGDDMDKKTYHGTPGTSSIPVYWSNNDEIKIYSPAANGEKAQMGIYGDRKSVV